MTAEKKALGQEIQASIPVIQALKTEMGKQVVGQEQVVQEMLIGLLASGHLLVEGVPGLGKTLLARSLATIVGSSFKRIQFTPDLMPSDITGHSLFDLKSNQFVIRRGPLFSHLVLADEINRAPAKTQAALLEAMQEQQVTIEGRTLPLHLPFQVIATQNPVEQEGTYPLPQAQIDRFMCKIFIKYPDAEHEKQIVRLATERERGDTIDTSALQVQLDPNRLLQLQNLVTGLTVDEQVIDYVVRLVRATRSWNGIEYGAGPRGGINLLRAARACAFCQERDFVMPDDVKQMALPVLRHRIKLSADVEIEGYTPDDVLADLLATVDSPRL